MDNKMYSFSQLHKSTQSYMYCARRLFRIIVAICFILCVLVSNLQETTNGLSWTLQLQFFSKALAEGIDAEKVSNTPKLRFNIQPYIETVPEEFERRKKEIENLISEKENCKKIWGGSDSTVYEKYDKRIAEIIATDRKEKEVSFQEYNLEFDSSFAELYTTPYDIKPIYFTQNGQSSTTPHIMKSIDHIEVAGYEGDWVLVRYKGDNPNERSRFGYVTGIRSSEKEFPSLDFSPCYGRIPKDKIDKDCYLTDGKSNYPIKNKEVQEPLIKKDAETGEEYIEIVVFGKIPSERYDDDGYYIEMKLHTGEIARGMIHSNYIEIQHLSDVLNK